MAKSKSHLPHGFKTEAEKISEAYRAEMGLSKFSRLDAFALAKHLDVPLCSMDELLDNPDIEKLKKSISDRVKVSAVCMKNCDGDKIILYNPFHSNCRQQSDIMHELAHIIRKHEMSEEVKRVAALFKMRPNDPVHEAEAIYLGGCLQITRAGLLWKLKENCSYQQIADYYGACLEMVQYRIKVTGVEKQRAYIDKRNSN